MNAKQRTIEAGIAIALLGPAAAGVLVIAGRQADLPPEAHLLLLCLPAAAWLGRPWRFADRPSAATGWWAAAAVAAAAGGMLASVSLLALAWTLALGGWLRRWLAPDIFRARVRLLVLASLALPWLLADGGWLGWIFRLSGAAVAATLAGLLGLRVEAAGTLLSIEGAPLSVEAACDGLESLQAMLCIGLVALFRGRGPAAPLAWPLLLLLALAWLANTLRIIGVAVLALTFGHAAASGLLHDLMGIAALGLVFRLATHLFERPARAWAVPPRPIVVT